VKRPLIALATIAELSAFFGLCLVDALQLLETVTKPLTAVEE
jgi:hypothetical protein